jgi:hypothetical protein
MLDIVEKTFFPPKWKNINMEKLQKDLKFTFLSMDLKKLQHFIPWDL